MVLFQQPKMSPSNPGTGGRTSPRLASSGAAAAALAWVNPFRHSLPWRETWRHLLSPWVCVYVCVFLFLSLERGQAWGVGWASQSQ